MFNWNKMPVYFDGYNISSIINVTNVDRGIGTTRKNNLLKAGRQRGTQYKDYTYDEKIISMDFSISGDLIDRRRQLGKVLNVREPKKLIFGDEPDKYYLAIPDGNINLDEAARNGKGTINWIVPKGVAYSEEIKTFEINNDTTKIINEGTERTPIDIDIKFETDAKSIGFVTEDKILQFGTPDTSEPGVSEYKPSTLLFNDGMDAAKSNKWNKNVARLRWRENDGDNTSKLMGSWSYKDSTAFPSSYGSIDASKPGYWHGPSLSYNFVLNTYDIDVYHRLVFKSTGNKKNRIKQQGIAEINYLDSDGNFIMGVEFKDNTNNKERTSVKFFVGDTQVYYLILPPAAMINGGWFGSVEMKKQGNKFTFRLGKIVTVPKWSEVWSFSRSFYNETIASLKPARGDVWLSQWKNNPVIGDLGLTHTKILQLNTEDETITPNYFYAGDRLYVNGENNQVFVNEVLNDSFRVIGSDQMFEASEIENTEVVVITDGVYSGNLKIRERYV